MSDSADRLVATLDKLDVRLETLNTRLAQLHTDSVVGRSERARLAKMVDDHEQRIRANEGKAAVDALQVVVEDHEKRIRSNEKSVWKWAGALTVVVFAITMAVKLIP